MAMNRCIFCHSKTNSFTHDEHLVPESLGGDEIIPQGLVCDKCNQYFGKEVERPALSSPTMAFIRASLSITTKKGKQTRYRGFRFEIYGQACGESIAVFPPEKLQYISEHGTGQFIVPIVGLGSVARLLLKMGIECVALSQEFDVHSNLFDLARTAARAPHPNMKWPIAFGKLRLDDIKEYGEDEQGSLVTDLVYHYSLGQDIGLGLVLFSFSYSWAHFIVPLSLGDFQKATAQLNAINAPDYHLTVVEADLLNDV